MTNTDTELYELCKQVYEATGWIVSEYPNYWYMQQRVTGRAALAKAHPLYTSDYLLEKLSAITDYISVKQSNEISIDASKGEKGNWYAHYWFKSRRVQVKSDTPLKALLKLTLNLHEEGLL